MRRFVQGFVMGLAIAAGSAIAAAALGFLSVDAKATPPVWEVALAGRALSASLARHAAQMPNPAPPTEENLLAGLKTYQQMCAGCHGDPNGETVFGAGFYPKAPQFATLPPHKPDWQMFYIVKNGVRYTGMPAWEPLFGKNADERIWKVVAFLDHLGSLPPAVDAEWRKKPAS